MTRWCRRVRLRKLRKHSIVVGQVPTMILSVIQGLRPAKLHENESKPLHVFNALAHVFDPETRGLQLFWVVRGCIELRRRLGAEYRAHRAPNHLLDTLPRTRASQEPIRYHGVAKPWEIPWGSL
jgi:hypothetical protein